MEGANNQVLSVWQVVPHETYVYFMDLITKTVRDEIAGCSEKCMIPYLSTMMTFDRGRLKDMSWRTM
ncbi:26S proteasome non-ATPase regulatory subunit 8 homolog A, partial [Zea mays]